MKPDVPSWRAARPPRQTLDWVVREIGPGARVARVRRLDGGSWQATHAVDVDDGAGRRHELVLRRWARPGWELDDPGFTAAREAAVLERVATTRLPVPKVVAADPEAASCDVPTLLQSRLPGRPLEHVRSRPSASAIRQLSEALVTIHSLDLGLREVASAFDPYYGLDELSTPAATKQPGLWAAAFELAASPPPAGPERFMHRDYHPANTLWLNGRLTGIVDWTAASWGPPAADLAHLRSNLGVFGGPELAEVALVSFLAAGGTVPDRRYWDVRMLLDLGSPEFHARLDAGERLEPFERYLAAVLHAD